MKTLLGTLRLARSWRVLVLVVALSATDGSILTTRPALGETGQPQLPQPLAERQTLDDLFAAVAQQVPDFGGMFYGPDEQTLQVYMRHISPAKLTAVQRAIIAVFGDTVIPQGGVAALKGKYGFLRLKEWYDRMVGPVLSIPGVTLTDIDEAKNRLGIGVEAAVVNARVAEQLRRLGIPRQAVAVKVTGPIELATHTVQSPFSPREGGYIIARLLCNQFGVGAAGTATLGFNAVRLSSSGNETGFVTVSHATAVLWNLDTNLGFPPAGFWQASSPVFPTTYLVGQETIDPQGFQGFPCPPGVKCRYSDSAFVRYNPGVAWAQGFIARTTGITTSLSSPIMTVDNTAGHNAGPGVFGISAPPSTPYLVGLKLNKVGTKTGWTQGTIAMTAVNVSQISPGAISMQVGCPAGLPPDPPTIVSPGILLSQYVVGSPNDVADGGDSGSPVFRINSAQLNYVELYGIVWARIGFTQFVFSPIGGSPYQPAGIQTDLGPLDYVGQCLPPSPPCQ